MVGQTISHYRITEKLGEGGMGVVYKAEDTKLERPVALKFLAPHAIEDPEHKARFVREAKAAARLDHQNICSVYEIDEADGQTFLAMAFLEGQTVKEKIAERPLKLEEALDIAIQTGQGLEAAHEKAIVHRDIKSANLMLTSQGQVKIMDFGLAQLADRSKLTKTTTMLGTPAYMSPEQALREPTDHRTDIWSLGVMLYEMLTGHLPFEGEREQAVLYAITNEEPEPVTALRSRLPTELDRVLGKALAKDRDERYQHADELLVDLRVLQKQSGETKPSRAVAAVDAPGPSVAPKVEPSLPEPTQAPAKPWTRFALPVAVGAATVFFALWVMERAEPEPERPVRKFTLEVTNAETPEISPDGRSIVYAAGDGLYVRKLADSEPRLLVDNLVRQGFGARPFWSPDSRSIGFASDGVLFRIDADGGTPRRLCSVGVFGGGSWSPDGESIVFTNFRVLYEVSAGGGRPKVIVRGSDVDLPDRRVLTRPRFLPTTPDRRILAYQIGQGATGLTLVVHDLDDGEPVALGKCHLTFGYSPPGLFLYPGMEGSSRLWALSFSLEDLTAKGEPFPVYPEGAWPSVSTDGTAVFVTGNAQVLSPRQLIWRSRDGVRLEAAGPPSPILDAPELSPDGRLALVNDGMRPAVVDLKRNVMSRLTSDDVRANSKQWTSSGVVLDHQSSPANPQTGLYLVPHDQSATRKLLAKLDRNAMVIDATNDGSIVYAFEHEDSPGVADEIYLLEVRADGSFNEARRILSTVPGVSELQVSPDGELAALVRVTDYQGRVYVQAFPEGGASVLVSASGGEDVRWNPLGGELFYIEGETLMSVEIKRGEDGSVEVSIPRPLFSDRNFLNSRVTHSAMYDVAPDGLKFLVVEAAEPDPEARSQIRVVENWYEEFRDRE